MTEDMLVHLVPSHTKFDPEAMKVFLMTLSPDLRKRLLIFIPYLSSYTDENNNSSQKRPKLCVVFAGQFKREFYSRK